MSRLVIGVGMALAIGSMDAGAQVAAASGAPPSPTTAPPGGAGTPCGQFDDGASEQGLGLIAGGEFGWIHYSACLTQVEGVRTAYGSALVPGSVTNGSTSRIAVYQDDDADPSNGATLMATVSTIVTNGNTDVLNPVPLGATVTITPGMFGALLATADQVAGEFPGPLDTDNPTDSAWVVGNTMGPGTLDLANLPANNFPPDTLAGLGYPGAWLLRAEECVASEPGTRLCFGIVPAMSGAQNSTGVGAVLDADGSPCLGRADLYLETWGNPVAEPVFLLMSTDLLAGGGGVPFLDGFRCVGAPIIELGLRATDAGGTARWGPLQGLIEVDPGETRYFQTIYADRWSGGFRTNLSNAYSITFEPGGIPDPLPNACGGTVDCPPVRLQLGQGVASTELAPDAACVSSIPYAMSGRSHGAALTRGLDYTVTGTFPEVTLLALFTDVPAVDVIAGGALSTIALDGTATFCAMIDGACSPSFISTEAVAVTDTHINVVSMPSGPKTSFPLGALPVHAGAVDASPLQNIGFGLFVETSAGSIERVHGAVHTSTPIPGPIVEVPFTWTGDTTAGAGVFTRDEFHRLDGLLGSTTQVTPLGADYVAYVPTADGIDITTTAGIVSIQLDPSEAQVVPFDACNIAGRGSIGINRSVSRAARSAGWPPPTLSLDRRFEWGGGVWPDPLPPLDTCSVVSAPGGPFGFCDEEPIAILCECTDPLIAPCDNPSTAGRGCANTTGAGAFLIVNGSTSAVADDLAFQASGLVPTRPAVLFTGGQLLNGGVGVPFGSGLLCAGAPWTRLGMRVVSGAGNADWAAGLGASGGWTAGDTRVFQVWYGDLQSICNPQVNAIVSNLTSAVSVTFTP